MVIGIEVMIDAQGFLARVLNRWSRDCETIRRTAGGCGWNVRQLIEIQQGLSDLVDASRGNRVVGELKSGCGIEDRRVTGFREVALPLEHAAPARSPPGTNAS